MISFTSMASSYEENYPSIKFLKTKEQVVFEHYSCVGLVLNAGRAATTIFAAKNKPQLLTFNPEDCIIETKDFEGFSNLYTKHQRVYQVLVGNKKGWISHIELEYVLAGEFLV